MKKIFRNNKLIALAFMTVFTLTIAPGSPAQSVIADVNPALQVNLKYLGNMKEFAMFQLAYTGNEEENAVRVYILDVYGNTLFNENIYGNSFTKKFYLNKDELNEVPVRFEIVGIKSKKKVVFEINRNVNFVEEMKVMQKY